MHLSWWRAIADEEERWSPGCGAEERPSVGCWVRSMAIQRSDALGMLTGYLKKLTSAEDRRGRKAVGGRNGHRRGGR